MVCGGKPLKGERAADEAFPKVRHLVAGPALSGRGKGRGGKRPEVETRGAPTRRSTEGRREARDRERGEG